jgi:hypothetical protein
MTELEQAEQALSDAKARVNDLATMGSLELHAAVAGGPSHAQDLLNYHVGLRTANKEMMAIYMHARNLPAAQGLPPPDPCYEIPPDFGPIPPDKEAFWHLLFGSLNGSDLDNIARCLDELKGWTPPDVSRPRLCVRSRRSDLLTDLLTADLDNPGCSWTRPPPLTPCEQAYPTTTD